MFVSTDKNKDVYNDSWIESGAISNLSQRVLNLKQSINGREQKHCYKAKCNSVLLSHSYSCDLTSENTTSNSKSSIGRYSCCNNKLLTSFSWFSLHVVVGTFSFYYYYRTDYQRTKGLSFYIPTLECLKKSMDCSVWTHTKTTYLLYLPNYSSSSPSQFQFRLQ